MANKRAVLIVLDEAEARVDGSDPRTGLDGDRAGRFTIAVS
jgi:hypothetical protein